MTQGRIAAEGPLGTLRQRIPAALLAFVETEDEATLIRKTEGMGWGHRYFAGNLAILLPERYTLRQIIDRFGDLTITSIRLQEIGLEHVYLEVMGAARASNKTKTEAEN